MNKLAVEFKGTKDGVVIFCPETPDFNRVLAELADRLKQRSAFFAEAEVRVDVGTRKLSQEEIELLARTIEDNSKMKLAGIQTVEDRRQTHRPGRRQEEKKLEGARENSSLVIRRTLRSGQSVFYPGNVVVLGDINPGAEIVAEGDIYIFGTVRGTAHAGAAGDRSAVVVALRLAPTQLRIADLISRAPDEEPLVPDQPEYAYISGDRIMIASINARLG